MRYGLDVSIAGEYSNPRTLAELAVEAEQAGWDGFFVQDYVTSNRPIADPWISLAVIAMRTERVRIGAVMTTLPRRRPWKVARATVAIDHFSLPPSVTLAMTLRCRPSLYNSDSPCLNSTTSAAPKKSSSAGPTGPGVVRTL